MKTRALRVYNFTMLEIKVASRTVLETPSRFSLLWCFLSKMLAQHARACHSLAIALLIDKMSQNQRKGRSIDFHICAGKFLFALCEGNFCTGGKKGKRAGNGRIIISQLEAEPNNENDCRWVNFACLNLAVLHQSHMMIRAQLSVFANSLSALMTIAVGNAMLPHKLLRHELFMSFLTINLTPCYCFAALTCCNCGLSLVECVRV